MSLVLRQFACLLVAILPIVASAADAPFSITFEPKNNVLVQAFRKSPPPIEGTGRITAHVDGEEKSECRDYGRMSSADATAEVQVLSRSPDSISLSLTSNSLARGGHYRTCVQCIAGNCVGLMGNDTSGQARAVATGRIAIAFNPDFRATDYLLDVSLSAQGAKPTIRLTDSSGSELPLRRDQGAPAVLHGGASSYYVNVELPTVSSNDGGCCDDQKINSARVDLRVLKAPILDTLRSMEPYIKGGDETSAYPYVGAILLDGRLHCTGTLVASITVLTAAHCLNGYESQVNKMSFIFGSNVIQPTQGPLEIARFEYPKDAGSGFMFNPKTLEDDIGVVYLKQPVLSIVPAKTHTSIPPSWDTVLARQSNLIFVGYGYDVVENQKIAAGVKREAAWAISGVQNRRVSFMVPGKNTCKGDSGGPAFVIQDGSLIQIGITSGGDRECTTGFDTRVDAYASWLKDRFH